MNMDELQGMIDWCADNLQGYYGRFKQRFSALSDEEKKAFLDEVNAHSVQTVSHFIMFMEE